MLSLAGCKSEQAADTVDSFRKLTQVVVKPVTGVARHNVQTSKVTLSQGFRVSGGYPSVEIIRKFCHNFQTVDCTDFLNDYFGKLAKDIKTVVFHSAFSESGNNEYLRFFLFGGSTINLPLSQIPSTTRSNRS